MSRAPKTACEGQQCHDCAKLAEDDKGITAGGPGCPHTYKDEDSGFWYGPNGDEPACWEFEQE